MVSINDEENIYNEMNVVDYPETLREELPIVFSLNEDRVKLDKNLVLDHKKSETERLSYCLNRGRFH